MLLRGGLSFIGDRYANVYDKNITEILDDDIDEKKSSLLYLDVNNLYGMGLCDNLPVSSYTWLTETEINNLDIESLSDTENWGCILEVDLSYHKELHNEHDNLPFAPETLMITLDMMSPYSRKSQDELYDNKTIFPKLVSTLSDKMNYVTTGKNLAFYLSQGLKLKKVHRGFKYKTTTKIRAFVQKITKMRSEATNVLHKNMFKLVVNSIYGKFIQDNQKHIETVVVRTEEKFLETVNNPYFISSMTIDKDFMLCFKKPNKIKVNKPLFMGVSFIC